MFISYVREDSAHVDRLQHILEQAGISTWRDTEKLWPGQDWRAEIRRAITNEALVVLVCFSMASMSRKASYQNEELTVAIEQLRLRAPDDPWLIPVRFDACEIPDRDIGGSRTLGNIQRADLFGAACDENAARLVQAIRRLLGDDTEAASRLVIPRALHVTDAADVSAGLRHSEREASSGQEALDGEPAGRAGIPGLHFIQQLAFHPSGRLLSWISGDGWASILDLETFEVVADLPGYAGMSPILFTPDGSLFIIGHDDGYGKGDGKIEVFDWQERNVIATFEGPDIGVADVCVDSSGKYLVASFYGRCTKVWELATRREVAELDESGWLACSADCERIAITGFQSGHLRIFEMRSQTWLDLGLATFAASFAPDGSLIAAASGHVRRVPGAGISLWSLPGGTPVHAKRPSFPEFKEISYDRWLAFCELLRVIYSPDGKDLALIMNCGAAVYEIQGGRVRFILEDDSFNDLPQVAFDPTGRWIAVSSINPPIYLWDRHSERVEIILNG